MRRPAMMLAFALAAASAGAQTVYRCGDGGRSYTQQPCAGGQAVDVSDPRSAEDRAQGEQAARRDAELADRWARERRAREAGVKPVGAGGIDGLRHPPPPAAPVQPTAKPKKHGKPKKAKPVHIVAPPPPAGQQHRR